MKIHKKSDNFIALTNDICWVTVIVQRKKQKGVQNWRF